MDPLVVELLGARGVGKSTLTELLLAELRSKNLSVESTVPRGLGARLNRQLVTLADRWSFLTTTLAWRPPSMRDLSTFRKRYRRIRLSATIYSGRPGIRLIDEGVFQLIMELQAKTAQKDVWRIADRLARLVTLPDLVLLVDAPGDAIEERRRRRGNRGDILRPRLAPWERNALASTRKLLTHRAGSGLGPALIEIDNADGSCLASTASKLADELAAHFARRWEMGTTPQEMQSEKTPPTARVTGLSELPTRPTR